MKSAMRVMWVLALLAGLLIACCGGAVNAAEDEGQKGVEELAQELFGKLSKSLENRDGGAFVDLVAPSTWEELLIIYNMESMYSCESSCEEKKEATVDDVKQLISNHLSSNPMPISLNLDEAKKLSSDRVMLKFSISFNEETGMGEDFKMPCVLYAVNENGKWSLSAGVSTMMLMYMGISSSSACVAECVEVPAPVEDVEEAEDSDE